MALKRAENSPLEGLEVDPTSVKVPENLSDAAESEGADPTPAADAAKEVEVPGASSITVDTTPVDESRIPPEPEAKVRVRMRCDHRCTIAMEFYDLKKGQCYNVTQDVKRILSRAGLLDPL